MKDQNIQELQNKIEDLKKKQKELEKESMQIIEQQGGSSFFSIRPAGRHLITIGEELIQDPCAAVIELVKNAYDADSKDAIITFENNGNNTLSISIEDHGNGMTTEDIVNKWLVPSTSNKRENRESPNGRIMQGRKGIGRFAAGILGDSFEMQTVHSGVLSSVSINWKELSQYEYLDQARVNVTSCRVQQSNGTTIRIIASELSASYWTEQNINTLRFELKRLISPYEEDNKFEIYLHLININEKDVDNGLEKIEPYEILDYYDYRISGTVHENGIGLLTYETQKIKNAIPENINFSFLQGATECGTLTFDIRVYDRDKDAIDALIDRGLKDPKTGQYVSKNRARMLIDDVNGIGVYRNGFRIRPLGNADFDWLKLNEDRVQNPSLRIGSNQVT